VPDRPAGGALRTATTAQRAWASDGLDERRLHVADIAGASTRYFDAGAGEPIVLIHGGQFGALYSLDCWSLNLEPLAREFRVVAFDRLGQGYTDNPARAADYRFERVMEHVHSVLDRLGLDGIHVVGHSRGAMVAARVAIERPGRVRSLTLVDAGAVAPFDPALPVGHFYAPLEHPRLWRKPDRATVVAEPEAQAVHAEWITDDFVERMLRIALLPKTRAARRTVTAQKARWAPSLERYRDDTLSLIDREGLPVPTLVLWGYNDRSAPRHSGLRLFERIAVRTPDAIFQMLNGAGHYCYRDRPDAFNEALSTFVRQHAGDAGG
jgi:2-hydroxy-6-oxonona-2,4-dienedioate hydrolase